MPISQEPKREITFKNCVGQVIERGYHTNKAMIAVLLDGLTMRTFLHRQEAEDYAKALREQYPIKTDHDNS